MKIKICGLTRLVDVEAVNALKPDYVGFVFAPTSKRRLTRDRAAELKRALDPTIEAVGVFVDETPENVAKLLDDRAIDLAQLHGSEDDAYIRALRKLTAKPIVKAFRVRSEQDVLDAENSSADHILLDAGAGTGTTFDWSLLRKIRRPYFLAGGLNLDNIDAALELEPFAVDVSSGVETDGLKDQKKMAEFVAAVRKKDIR
ncbi:MAG: phosphoribosylanthranilate isomerase [Thermoguttaceae bacterium]|nr:phosphoribosylanthranilate isomerase [Thermoguttaceae bacterium]